MTSSSSLEIDSGALLKILLHAAKHPSSDVLGVLVGRPIAGAAAAAAVATEAASDADADDADDRKSNASVPSSSGRVVDALPLFHESVGLTPMLEVALLQVRKKEEERSGSLAFFFFLFLFSASFDLSPLFFFFYVFFFSTSSFFFSLHRPRPTPRRASSRS